MDHGLPLALLDEKGLVSAASKANRPLATAIRWDILAGVAVAHALSFLLLLWAAPQGAANQAPGILQVRWLNAEHPAAPMEPEPEPAVQPKPLPLRSPRPAATPPPMPTPVLSLDAGTPAPSTVPAAPPAMEPGPVHQENAAALPQGPAATPGLHQAEAEPAPTAPGFDADYLSNPAPPYPAVSRRLREQGLVVLHVHVTAQGQPDKVQLHQGSGFARLDQAALDVVWHWRFTPARQGGKDVAGWVSVPLRFVLRS